jgi:hypothetical protein
MWIGVRAVAMVGAGGSTIITDANEHDTTVSVRKAHDRVHQLVVR